MRCSWRALGAAAGLVLASVFASGALGAPPVQLIEELAAAEAAQRNGALTIDERAAAADRAVDARARLIEAVGGGAAGAGGEDDRLPTWLVDQAAAMLDRLSLDGADASALFGVPTARQRERVQAEAWGAMQLVARADESAQKLARSLQAGAMDATGKSVEQVREQAARVEAALSRLVDTEQAVRVPYYRGRAACLLAALEAGDGGKAAREDNARVALESLAKLPLGNTSAESIRRVTLGASMLMLFPRDDKPRADARQLFAWVTAQPSAADGPSATTRVQAWMGLVRCARGEPAIRSAVSELAKATAQEPFVVAHRTDPLLALLAAEGVARAMLSEVPRDPAAKSAWVSEALTPMVALLSREDLKGDQPVLGPIVLAKIAAACDGVSPGVAWAKMDPRIGFARAMAAAQGGGGGASGGAAAGMLEEIVAREDAGDLRASALWELAVLRSRGPAVRDSLEAAATLCRLAREYPASPQAAEAALKALELVRYTLGGPAKAGASVAEIARLNELYGQSLELAYKLRPNDSETAARRVERARLILDGAGAAGSRDLQPAQLDAVLDALDGVRGGDGAAALAKRQADDLAASAVQDAIGAARRASATPLGRDRLIAVSRRAVQWAQAARPMQADAYRLTLAETLADANDSRSLAVFEELAARNPPIGGDDAWRIRLGLGRAQRIAGRAGDGFATLRALVEAVDQSMRDAGPGAGPNSGAPARPVAYWGAWAEMLEILAADNAQSQRTETIRLQIKRLRVLSPDLGGDTTRLRIEAVARGVGA